MTNDALLHRLVTDLESLGERFADERFCTALYRALARTTWSKKGGPDGHVSLSFSLAEDLVNELRGRHGQPPLTLAQTGGEGEVDSTVDGELARLGWTHRPLNTSRGDEQHVAKEAESPSPQAPAGSQWEEDAHAAAEETRQRTVPIRGGGSDPSAGGAA